nr:MFS transporter [Paraburkholderia sp. Ac-20347]
MVDLVGLPLWVGILIESYRFDPQQAGGLATLFLAGIVIASALLAPRFNRLSGRLVATAGFSISACGFFIAATTRDSALLTGLHAICGLAAGAGLSVTHGTISQGERPHRLMAIAGVALGVFAVIFMTFVPGIVVAHGGPSLFVVFGTVMAAAALVSFSSFPPRTGSGRVSVAQTLHSEPLPRAVWFGLAAFACVCLEHAMANSFLERVGIDHGFSHGQIGSALLGMSIVSIFPGALAAWTENRLSIRGVLFIAPILHAALVVVLMNATSFPAYVAAMVLLPGLMIFMHTFTFGAIAKLDRSGRSLAAFPASIMIGSALGPVVGGTLVKFSGYRALGSGAMVLCIIIVSCFLRLTKGRSSPVPVATSGL